MEGRPRSMPVMAAPTVPENTVSTPRTILAARS
jgi:hypothetical protein